MFSGTLLLFDDSMDVGSLISGSSAFSKSSLNIWKFLVHILLKPKLENFECVRWVQLWSSLITFFGIAFLWDWNENWPFPGCVHCWVFQVCWHIECSTFTSSSFRIWNSSAGIPSPPLALFMVMLPKVHLTSHSRMSGFRWMITLHLVISVIKTFFFVHFFSVFLPRLLNLFCFC